MTTPAQARGCPLAMAGVLIGAGIMLLAVPVGMVAGPPFITDDPEPVEYQHWECYVASQSFKAADGWSGTAPHFEVNYGAISNLQLHIIAPLAYDSPTHGPAHWGFGDLELGVKYRFVHIDHPHGVHQDICRPPLCRLASLAAKDYVGGDGERDEVKRH